MPEDTTNVDVAELLAIIGEQQVMARKREQRINELTNKIKELEETAKKSSLSIVKETYELDKKHG